LKSILNSILVFLSLYASLSLRAQSIDCQTDFWTITSDGFIQQWSLSNGSIIGGDTILSGGGISLSYCGNQSAPTFYTDNWNQGQIGINYFDAASGWVNIPTSHHVQDNGGHLDDQYYMVVGGVINYVNYWDGTNLTVIDSLHGEFFAGIFDIAVDTSGQAWIFTASFPGTAIDSLKVYDRIGKLRSYSFPYDIHGYGSFFLNDTLYLGSTQDSIYPVHINGNTAQLGSGIAFPSNNFTDMASCQFTPLTFSTPHYSETEINVFPNPGNGNFSIDLGEEQKSVKISLTDLNGKLIQSNSYRDIQMLNLKLDEPVGIYLLTIETAHNKELIRLLIE
jgi:hypothetical protein